MPIRSWGWRAVCLTDSSRERPFLQLFSEEWLRNYASDLKGRESRVSTSEKLSDRYWALKYIERAVKDPANSEIFQSLVAYPVMKPHMDVTKTAEAVVRAHVPALGTFADLSGTSGRMPDVGEPCKVTIVGLRRGIYPKLIVKQV